MDKSALDSASRGGGAPDVFVCAMPSVIKPFLLERESEQRRPAAVDAALLKKGMKRPEWQKGGDTNEVKWRGGSAQPARVDVKNH